MIVTWQAPCRPPKNHLFILVLSISRNIELWTFCVYHMYLQGHLAVEHQTLTEIWDFFLFFFFLFFFSLNGNGEQLVSVIFMIVSLDLSSVDKLSLLFSFIPAFFNLLREDLFFFQRIIFITMLSAQRIRPQTVQKDQGTPGQWW